MEPNCTLDAALEMMPTNEVVSHLTSGWFTWTEACDVLRQQGERYPEMVLRVEVAKRAND